MADQSPGIHVEQKVLTPSCQIQHVLAMQDLIEIEGDWPAQAPIPDSCSEHALMFHMGRQTSAHGFNFGQFWHGDGRF